MRESGASITDYWAPITDFWAPITDYWDPITDYWGPIIDYWGLNVFRNQRAQNGAAPVADAPGAGAILSTLIACMSLQAILLDKILMNLDYMLDIFGLYLRYIWTIC